MVEEQVGRVDILAAATYALVLAVALGLSFWTERARTDRSAIVGLYLVFGIPGVLLALWGIAALTDRYLIAITRNGDLYGFSTENGPLFLSLASALTLPLVPPFRRLVARVTPVDPASPIDMVGLCLILTACAAFAFILVNIGNSPEDLEIEPVSLTDLALTAVFELALAYVAVGWLVRRDLRSATERLDIRWPGWKTWLIAIGFLILSYAGSAVGSVLTDVYQPELSDQINDVTDDLTADVQNPVGAVVLGASAGVGEEALFRGAIQPRFGIVLTAVAFALVHSQYGLSYVIVGLFLVGVVLGLERRYFGTTAAMITHAMFNVIAVLVASAS